MTLLEEAFTLPLLFQHNCQYISACEIMENIVELLEYINSEWHPAVVYGTAITSFLIFVYVLSVFRSASVAFIGGAILPVFIGLVCISGYQMEIEEAIGNTIVAMIILGIGYIVLGAIGNYRHPTKKGAADKRYKNNPWVFFFPKGFRRTAWFAFAATVLEGMVLFIILYSRGGAI